MSGEERSYRRWVGTDLQTFEVRVAESDLLISAERLLPELAEQALRLAREQLEGYLQQHPEFERSLIPISVAPDTPDIVQRMAQAAEAAGVGPMASVAGAVAEIVGEALLTESAQVIVENGGDLFLQTSRPRVAAIYAGSSPLSGKLGLKISQLNQPLGLATSSGTVGPSLSFGRADAAIVLAQSAAWADAAASALGNRVQTADDIERALEQTSAINGVLGCAVILGEYLGAWGEMEFVPLGREG